MATRNVLLAVFALTVVHVNCALWSSDVRLLRPRRSDDGFEKVETVPVEELPASVQQVVTIPAQPPCYSGPCVQPLLRCSMPPCNAAAPVVTATVVQDHTIENAKMSHDELETQAEAIESLVAEESAARAFSEKRAEVAERKRAKVEKAARREEAKAAGMLGETVGRAQQEALDRAHAVAAATVAAEQFAAASAARTAAEREQNATEAALRKATADATASVLNGSAAFADVAVAAGEAEVKATRLEALAASSAEAAETAKVKAQAELASANEARNTYETLVAKAAASEQQAALLRTQADAYTERMTTALRAYQNMTTEAETAQQAAESATAAAAAQLDSGMQEALSRIQGTASVATGALAQVRSSALRSEGTVLRRVNRTIEELIPNAPRVEMPKMAMPIDPPSDVSPCSACS